MPINQKLFDLHERYQKHNMQLAYKATYASDGDVDVMRCECGGAYGYIYKLETRAGCQQFRTGTNSSFVHACYAAALSKGDGDNFIAWLRKIGSYQEFFTETGMLHKEGWGCQAIYKPYHKHYGKIKHLIG